jgi:hypothetical protein
MLPWIYPQSGVISPVGHAPLEIAFICAKSLQKFVCAFVASRPAKRTRVLSILNGLKEYSITS